MTCKDCYLYGHCHYDVHITKNEKGEYIQIPASLDAEKDCEGFKDKSLIVELPCKVGDTMYKLCTVYTHRKFGDMWDGHIVRNNCDRCGYRNCSCYDIGLRQHENDMAIDIIETKVIKSIEFAVKILPYVGTIWFRTREEAEGALNEMRSRIGGTSNDL